MEIDPHVKQDLGNVLDISEILALPRRSWFAKISLINGNIKHDIVSKKETIANCKIDTEMEKYQWKNIIGFIASLSN